MRTNISTRDAIAIAKQYVADVFADENIINLGLEEVAFDDQGGAWNVTVGFSRPWNTVRNALTALAGEPAVLRSYKTVRVDDKTRDVLSIKDRELAE